MKKFYRYIREKPHRQKNSVTQRVTKVLPIEKYPIPKVSFVTVILMVQSSQLKTIEDFHLCSLILYFVARSSKFLKELT